MKFIIYAVYGCIIGIANIIPGVSGGTMAVMLNIYDKLISSFNELHLVKIIKNFLFNIAIKLKKIALKFKKNNQNAQNIKLAENKN